VNFITAHDGFTLNDLVSYNEKHNEANGEDNRDGHSHNRSWTCGAEGATDDAEINKLRERQMRNFLGTLLLSQGTPMLLAGDEFARTQNGNNNAYCQNNEISWLDWNLTEHGKAQLRFVQKLCQLRHEHPALRRGRFLTGEFHEKSGVKDVTWISATGKEMAGEEWQNGNTRCFGMLIDGHTGRPTGGQDSTDTATALIVFNAHHDVVNFNLPTLENGTWQRHIDTNLEPDVDVADIDGSKPYAVTGRSLLLLLTTGRVKLD
jgi:glycogen operon protein